jgi:hypothetical protein
LTKEKLKDYRTLRIEITQLEQDILEHINSSYLGGSVIDGQPRGSNISDITANLALESLQLYAMLNSKKLDAVRLRKEIEVCIETLTTLERVLMRERYIMGKEWEEVCITLGYSWRQTHRIHGHILNKIR